jgi:hypothetical protein
MTAIGHLALGLLSAAVDGERSGEVIASSMSSLSSPMSLNRTPGSFLRDLSRRLRTLSGRLAGNALQSGSLFTTAADFVEDLLL